MDKIEEIHNLVKRGDSGGTIKLGYKILPIESFKASRDSAGIVSIEGYANTKNHPDRYGDIPTVFTKLRPNVYDLSHFKNNPVMMLAHGSDISDQAGSFSEKMGGYVMEDEKGLAVKGIFSNSSLPAVAHARTLAEEGHLKAFSIGGKWSFEDKDNPTHLTNAEIYEISLVPVPADPEALAKGYDVIKELSEKIKKGEPVESELLGLCKKYSVLIDISPEPSQLKAEEIQNKADCIVEILLI